MDGRPSDHAALTLAGHEVGLRPPLQGLGLNKLADFTGLRGWVGRSLQCTGRTNCGFFLRSFHVDDVEGTRSARSAWGKGMTTVGEEPHPFVVGTVGDLGGILSDSPGSATNVASKTGPRPT